MMLRLTVICWCSLVLACSSSSPKLTPEIGGATHKSPKGLIVEHEIKGEMLRLKLSKPSGLTVGRDGTIYVCDEGNNRIVKLDAEFIPRVDTRGYGREEGGLDRPAFIWLDNSLNLVVADPGNRRLVWFDRGLNYVDELELIDEEDPLKFGEIASVAGTSYGELWVVDWEMGRIALFNNVGQFQSFVGDFGYSGGGLSRPEKIVSDQNKGFLLCDAGNSRIVRYDNHGNVEKELEDDLFNYPISVCQSDENNLWVLEGGTGQILFFDSEWSRQYVTGPILAGSRLPLKEPSDIVLLSEGRLLISDTGNDRVIVCRVYYE